MIAKCSECGKVSKIQFSCLNCDSKLCASCEECLMGKCYNCAPDLYDVDKVETRVPTQDAAILGGQLKMIYKDRILQLFKDSKSILIKGDK